MKRLILGGVAACVAGVALWMGFFPQDWQNWLGFSSQATSQYAFVSGVGPMLLTAAGMGTIVGSLWRAHNCHAEGCWNIGRHKVNGSPWCDQHHEEARSVVTAETLLAEILDAIKGGGKP